MRDVGSIVRPVSDTRLGWEMEGRPVPDVGGKLWPEPSPGPNPGPDPEPEARVVSDAPVALLPSPAAGLDTAGFDE